MMEDRRTLRTKKAVRKAFLELLKEKPLSRITVAGLSKRADIGRGTFYLHYKDVYDLYEQIEDELYDELTRIFDASYSTTNPAVLFTMTEMLTGYLSDNRELFRLLMRPEDGGKTLHKLRLLFTDKTLIQAKKTSAKSGEVWNAGAAWTVFAVAGVIGVLEEWLHGNIAMSKQQLSQVLHRILVKLNF